MDTTEALDTPTEASAESEVVGPSNSLISDEVKYNLENFVFNSETSEITMVSHQKSKGKLEVYSIYSQNPKNDKWIKEFSVFIKKGKVKAIKSHKNKKIEEFSAELEEIVALEKKFQEKIKSAEVSDSKESLVSQFVKNKKEKKVLKVKNKKFGKKQKSKR